MEKLGTLLLILFGLGAVVWGLLRRAQATAARKRRERPPQPPGGAPALSDNDFYKKMLLMQAQNAASPHEPGPAVVPEVPQPNWWRTFLGGPLLGKPRRPQSPKIRA